VVDGPYRRFQAFFVEQPILLLAAGNTGKAVKIKRGQFMAPGRHCKYAGVQGEGQPEMKTSGLTEAWVFFRLS